MATITTHNQATTTAALDFDGDCIRCHVPADSFCAATATASFITGSYEGVYSSLETAYNKYTKTLSPEIKKVEVLNPGKVVRFTFDDGSIIKTIRQEGDVFDFTFAFYLAFAKKLYGDKLTSEGIFKKAEELRMEKAYVKKVKRGMKVYTNSLKAAEKEAAEKAERKAIEIHRAEKKAKKKAAAREARIEEMAEAYRRANITK